MKHPHLALNHFFEPSDQSVEWFPQQNSSAIAKEIHKIFGQIFVFFHKT
ncbi:hypothetical protein C1752_03283 [Acaryochloris thomasi RCC1774]|uniref:Uncharacterized protein n=1 Tax=Acaryochloris thomasi RCC1774 TaxID=1764569 RepID=A0A2W1JHT8_9CYAN|nr:hypothetical protein C1752_03283 [Acaryochloris thomasi RCC1774]